MIKDFKHKGLETFYLTDSVKGINPNHAPKIRRILTDLNAMTSIKDMNKPNYKLHQLKGDLNEFFSVTVNGNWRITFKFENRNVYIVDYQDYH
jgi:toxin HigB-1